MAFRLLRLHGYNVSPSMSRTQLSSHLNNVLHRLQLYISNNIAFHACIIM